MSIKLLSLNVRGLKNKFKREVIFQWLKDQSADICLLQETHCSSEDDSILWGKEWGGKCFWSLGSNMSKGVAIMLKENLDIKTVNVTNDNDGRLLTVTIEIDELQLHVVNIYAPNDTVERCNFFNELYRKLCNLKTLHANADLVVGGDFNCAVDNKIDRRYTDKRNFKKHDVGTKELELLKNNLNLEDVWRRRYPKLKRYSYFKPNSKIASRIDFWLVEKTLDPFITSTSIKHAVRTDHASIQCVIKTSEQERGPGYWKFNNSLLTSDLFKQTFLSFWHDWKEKMGNYNSKREWWEITKYKIKCLSIEISKQILLKKRIKFSVLNKKLEQLKNDSDANCFEIRQLEGELSELWDQKTEGARIRAGEAWYEKGEKSSKYFFNLEKIRSRGKLWTQIKDSEGKIKHGIDNILEEQVQFYSKLLKSEGWDEQEAEKLLTNIDKTLTDDERLFCDQKISEKEVCKAIHDLKINKSPGEDGITAEFYQTFWPEIKDQFMQVIREIEENKTLCESMYKGIISLLYKCGDRDIILNWRPITLLNIDYKIIAKVFAERLKHVLPSIISHDQKACVKGRQITDTIRLIQDIIDKVDNDDSEGAIIFLDQQKAFDRVEWGYLNACLKKFGFGEYFCNAMTMLYKDAKSCIHTNGHLSRYFSVTRSMRQGCPIAAFLYILQAEPMAETMRKSDKLDGIKISLDDEVQEVKVASFADDTQLFHTSENSIIEGFKILETFSKASGAKLNMKKTKGLYIGAWKNKEPIFKEIKWEKSVNGLGVEFGYQINYEEIWMQKFAKFKNKINKWKERDLTLFGKKVLINSYILSSISYLAEVYTANIPAEFIKQTNDLIREFLWGGKLWKVSQKNMAMKKEHGGLEIPDLEAFIEARKIKWILRIRHSELQRWNMLGKKQLKLLDTKFGKNFFILSCSSLKELNVSKLSKFYKECITTWVNTATKHKVDTKQEVLEQNLFGNHNVKHSGKPLFFHHWSKVGLQKISDIWNNVENKWISSYDILRRLEDKRNWMAEYTKIKNGIPKQWINKLQDNVLEIEEDSNLQNPRKLKLTEDQILLNESEVELKKLKTKDIYFHCLYPLKNPKFIEAWERKLQIDIDWKKIFKILMSSIQGNKQKQLHWKIIHRAVYSETKLQSMGKSNGICKLCNQVFESITHIFYDCCKIKNIWKEVDSLILEHTGVDTSLDLCNILFGIFEPEIKDKNHIINTIILETKWQLWKNRNNVKFGKKNCLDVQHILDKVNFEFRKQIKYFLTSQKGRKFKQKWDFKLLLV